MATLALKIGASPTANPVGGRAPSLHRRASAVRHPPRRPLGSPPSAGRAGLCRAAADRRARRQPRPAPERPRPSSPASRACARAVGVSGSDLLAGWSDPPWCRAARRPCARSWRPIAPDRPHHAALEREQARVLRAAGATGPRPDAALPATVSSYETDRPDLVSVVLDAHGFTDLLEQINFLGRAERAAAVDHRVHPPRQGRRPTSRHAGWPSSRPPTGGSPLRPRIHVQALAGMNELLRASRRRWRGPGRPSRSRSQPARRAASAALPVGASRPPRRAAAAAARPRPPPQRPAPPTRGRAAGTPTPSGPALGPVGRLGDPLRDRALRVRRPEPATQQRRRLGLLPDHPGTWRLFGGTGPAAYLASKAEQDAVAARIWNGGAGASNWVCAGIVGIH